MLWGGTGEPSAGSPARYYRGDSPIMEERNREDIVNRPNSVGRLLYPILFG